MLPSHLPEQVPAHWPLALAGIALPSHLPVHLPEHAPLISASHVPLHSPVQAAAALASHDPLHFASHSPWSLPGSHLTSTLPGVTDASQCAAQSPYTLMSAPQCGSLTSSVTLRFAPSFAFVSPIAF